MLHFGSYACLKLFCLVDHGIGLVVFVECLFLARTHGNVPSDIGRCIGSLLDSLVTRVTESHRFVAMQECVALGNVTDVPGGATHGVHQAGLSIRSDVNTKGLPASR